VDKEMMMPGVSYRGMHIPFFDEKKLEVWKYQMESLLFFTIGCLGIARGNAKKKHTKQLGLSHEEIAKRKRFNKKFVEKRNIGFNLLVQSMGMNAMYQSVINTTCCEIGDLFGAWKAIWAKYDSKKPAIQSQLATEVANCFQMPDEPMETFLNKINEICARMMVTDPGEDMKKAQVVKGVIDDFYSFAAQKPERFRRGAIFVQK
jgi:parvulin-like peptidyl-prolyl isomerase